MRRFIVLAFLLLFASPLWAANAVYQQLDTVVVWTDTGGDEQLDLGDGTNGLNDAVSCGSYHDFGADPRGTDYYIEVKIDGYDGAPTIGEGFHVYVAYGETTTQISGPITLNDTADIAGTTDQLKNFMYVGSCFNTTATAADDVVCNFRAKVTARYWAPCIHNDNADVDADFLVTSDAHTIDVYKVYPEVQ